jgi:hypothetical protein
VVIILALNTSILVGTVSTAGECAWARRTLVIDEKEARITDDAIITVTTADTTILDVTLCFCALIGGNGHIQSLGGEFNKLLTADIDDGAGV